MVTTRGGSDDRERIEELEALVAALKVYVVTHDQVRDIEVVQRELSDTLNTLSEETRDAMSIIQREFQEFKAHVSVLQMAMGRVGFSSVGGRGPRCRNLNAMRGQEMPKSLKISCLTWSNTFGSCAQT